MNKPVYIGCNIRELIKSKMHEFWYNCIHKGVHLRLINTDSFIMHNKTEDFYKDIANEVKKRFDSSNYKVDSPLGMGEKQKVLDMMKN